MEEDGLQTRKTAVPKFASFRPKASLLPHSNGEPEKNQGLKGTNEDGFSLASRGFREQPEEHAHRQKRQQSRERSKRPGHDSLRRKEHGHRESIQSRSYERTPVEDWNTTQNFYVTDRLGDPHNITYGTIHRYIIPRYLRTGAGNIIGLSIDNKIDRTRSNENSLAVTNRDSHWPGRRERHLLAKTELDHAKELRIRRLGSPDLGLENGSDFVPLSHSRKRKRKLGEKSRSSSVSESSDEEHRNHYRSIEGKAKPRERPVDEDLEFATDTVTTDHEAHRIISIDDTTRQQGIELSRRVDSHPSDVDAWFDLINHQDRLLSVSTVAGRHRLTNAEKRSIAEIKLSMYEKALEKVAKNESLERVLLGMMEEGSKIWDTKKLGNRWRSVLEEYPGFIGLWTKYLDFKQTNFMTFEYEDCRSTFLDCFRVLNSATPSKLRSSVSGHDIDMVRIYIVLRLTLFMRESGYTEHAVGLWQALLEFNFFMPKQFGRSMGDAQDFATHRDRLSSFEEFWESEVPRIGEEDAKGWESWTLSGGVTAAPKTDALDIPVNAERIFENWVRSERLNALEARSPARTVDDIQEDDPFRVVLFPDVRDCLFHTAGSELRSELLNAFLAFCRLPAFLSGAATSSGLGWRTDPLIMNDALEESDSFLGRWDLRASLVDASQGSNTGIRDTDAAQSAAVRNKSPFEFPGRHILISPDTLFAEQGRWFSVFDAWTARYEGEKGPIEQGLVRGALRMLVSIGIGGEDLAEYYLAFVAANDPDSTRKLAKSLLKKHTTSLRLYNAYALLEARTGKKTGADHVFGTAISMSKTFTPEAQQDNILLWRTWVWECLAKRDLESAMHHLLAIPESTTGYEIHSLTHEGATSPAHPSAAALLRVQRALTDGRENMLSTGRTNHAMLYAECLALFTYLTQDSDLSAALDIFHRTSSTLATRNLTNSPAHELLHQAKAKLLYHHMTHTHFFKPALIRSELAQSIRLFPTNTIFLSLYAFNEARFRIDDRVRSIMQTLVLNNDNTNATQPTITAWLFSIWTELHRSIHLGSNTHSVRATFENAIASRSGGSNPALWKLYVLFERGRGETRRARDVFFRGMRACPWAKEFYMLAFTHLRNVLAFEELRKVYEVLGEKGLRVHVDLEDVFERYDERRALAGDAGRVVQLPDDGSGDEAS